MGAVEQEVDRLIGTARELRNHAERDRQMGALAGVIGEAIIELHVRGRRDIAERLEAGYLALVSAMSDSA